MPRVNGGSPGKADGVEEVRLAERPRPVQAPDLGVGDRRDACPALGRPLERGSQALGLPGASTSGPLGRSVGHGGDSSTGVRRGRSGVGLRAPTAGLVPAPTRADAPPRRPSRRRAGRPTRPGAAPRSTIGICRVLLARTARSQTISAGTSASADDPDEPVAHQETEHQRPPNASMASWIRASGRSSVMTTLTSRPEPMAR